MKLGIVTPTYYRNDNKTIFYLKRNIDVIFSQTHDDFKLFLIGDNYKNQNEVEDLLKNYDSNKIYFENLPIAMERDNYTNKIAVWQYGGVNATNHGISKALTEGYDYICHLDHDDYWENTHLEEINKCIETTNADWVCTKSYYRGLKNLLPIYETNEIYPEFLPLPEGIIHSSVCMNFKTIPLKYVDIFKEKGVIGAPGDADLWRRSREYIVTNNLKSVLINKITCYHLEECYERN